MPELDSLHFEIDFDHANLSIRAYQTEAARTDQFGDTENRADLPLLGLAGEAGSLVAEVKKHERGDKPNEAYTNAVREELGDCLWYFTALCRRMDVDLAALATPPGADVSKVKFSDIQPGFHADNPPNVELILTASTAFISSTGAMQAAYHADKLGFKGEVAAPYLKAVLSTLVTLATTVCLSVQEAAVTNLYKINDRWPARRNFPSLLDEADAEAEQLPRKLQIDIFERTVNGKTYVYQRCNGIFIGDPLTDNKEDPDDYRFHDVFHYAYATVLGWSPVTRALFKLKRKSDRTKDENQDGARAILIEEGISSWLFEQSMKQNLFSGVESGKLSYDLLKTVKEFVTGYEADQCPLWLWEEAILEGFKCFRFLKKHRRGRLTINLKSRNITIQDLAK